MAPKWPTLDPVAQNALLEEITRLLVDELPEDWRELIVDYRVVGRNIDLAVGLRGSDDTDRGWDPPVPAIQQFQRLRGGMYRETEGTWFSCRYILTPPSKFEVLYNWTNEPDFQPYPAPEDFLLEEERFPRDERYMPPWYRDRLADAARA